MTFRILFVTDHLHVPQGGGGGERNTHELCLALTIQSVPAAVACTLRPDGSWLSWTSRIRRQVPPRREYTRDTTCGYPVFRGWDHSRIGEVVRRFRPDAIVVQSTNPEPLVQALAPCGVPMAAYFHEVEQVDHLRFLQGSGIPVIANSAFTAGRLLDACGLQCEVVLPLVDPQHYVTPMQPTRVLFVNTKPRKGVDLAYAVAELRPDIPFEFMLNWTHKPPELEALHARARAAGNITLHPPTQDMRPIYAQAKVLLAPSQWEETWGRVATEAHVNGIPVLGSDRGGLPQAIGQGGIVIPANAPPEDWVAALSLLWDDLDTFETASAAARAYAARPEIQPANITSKLLDILGRAMSSQVTRTA